MAVQLSVVPAQYQHNLTYILEVVGKYVKYNLCRGCRTAFSCKLGTAYDMKVDVWFMPLVSLN